MCFNRASFNNADVYKRQVRESGGVAVSVTDEEILDTWRQVSRTEGMLSCPEAVSYTHLDVYKRQVYEGVQT